jgi:hypothetical protein
VKHYFTTHTSISSHSTRVEIRASTEAYAETVALFICALASAAGVLEQIHVFTLECDDDGYAYCELSGDEPVVVGPAATRRAMASIILDARKLARAALRSRGSASWSSKRAFGDAA